MKVVWIIHWPNKIYMNIAKELAKLCNLYLIISNLKDFYRKEENYEIKYLNYYSNSKSKILKKILSVDFPILVYYKKLNKTLNDINPDVVISNLSYMPSSFQAQRWAKKHNKKFILQMEMKKKPPFKEIFWKIIKPKLNKIIQKSDLVLGWGKDVKIFVEKEFKKEVRILNASINSSLYKEKKTYKNTNKLLFVGRFVPYKNHKHIIDACKLLKKNKIEFKLTLVGKGPIKDDIINYIKENKLSKEVKIDNKKYKYEEMYKLYQKHDILILPSYNEAIGMVVPEAMASGVACIVSDTSGAKDYIKDNKNGLIFKTGDIDDLYDKISYFLNNREKIEEFGKKARKHIIENYTTDKITKKFYNQINEVIKK